MTTFEIFRNFYYRAFSSDVTAALLVYQDKNFYTNMTANFSVVLIPGKCVQTFYIQNLNIWIKYVVKMFACFAISNKRLFHAWIPRDH